MTIKKIFSLLFFVKIISLYSQGVPKGISYQAVAINNQMQSVAGKNPSDVYWSERNIKVRFTIYNQFPGGDAQMVEIHETKTDKYGVFSLVIGQGQQISGDLFGVQWEQGKAHLQVEIDFENNGYFKLIGIERFWSVPYAINSQNSFGNSGAGIDWSKRIDSIAKAFNQEIIQLKIDISKTDTSNENELQDLDFDGKTIGLTKSGKRILLMDNEIGNELQSLNLSNDTLIISGLDTFAGKIQFSNKVFLDYDKSDTNEIQHLIRRNDSIFLSNSSNGVPMSDFYASNKNTPDNDFIFSSNCLTGAFYDLSTWGQNNGWKKTSGVQKLADSLFVFSVSTGDNSSKGRFLYDAKNQTFNTTTIGTVTGMADSFFYTYGNTCEIYKINSNRTITSTGKSVSVKPWRNVPIINSQGDLIWVDSDKGLPLDIKKYNFKSGIISNYTNPNQGKNIGGFLRLNGDTILIGNEIYESKNMTQLRSLPSGLFSSSSIEFKSGSFLYYTHIVDEGCYRYSLTNGNNVFIGNEAIQLGSFKSGVIANVKGSIYGGNFGPIKLDPNMNQTVYINATGAIYPIIRGDIFDFLKRIEWLNRDDSIMGYIDYKTSRSSVLSHCINGLIPNSFLGFSDFD